MGKYIVQEPLRHDGEDFAIGGPIDLDRKAAEPLLASGVVIDQAAAKAKAEAEAAAKAKAESEAQGQD